MSTDEIRLAERCINTIRFLSIDAIQQAKSGHPGLPMGAAATAYTLWTKHLKHNPANPKWPDRDRFVLSAGHGSMLLYSLLHLTGYDLSLDDIKAFRQWESKTPGHPEYGITPGVEVTTGPLGQGISNAVGMAVAEAYLAARYNRPDHEIMNHFTYVIASDGDLMEGVASEACSLAGHLGLGKLIVLFDDNRISLAGSTHLTFTEDVVGRFLSYKWDVHIVDDGNDIVEINRALTNARAELDRPSIIAVRTMIGYGSPNKQDTYNSHGSPLGPEEVGATKENLGWPNEPEFIVPDEVLDHMRNALGAGEKLESEWQKLFEDYRENYSQLAADFERVMVGRLPDNWDTSFPQFEPDPKGQATRKASETVMQYLATVLPEFIGGSADLNPSCFTWLKGYGDFQIPGTVPEDSQGAVGSRWDYGGRNIHYGVREHAMGAISGGMALHGGIIPYTGTFLTFSDYMRPPMRLAALMGIRVMYVFTHDSIGLGEDGPTHQPVEQIMSLRNVPELVVIRPCDSAEVVEAWRMALLNSHGPTALVLTRQGVPDLDRSTYAPASGLQKGGYILWESSDNKPDVILIGTGSELHMTLGAGRKLAEEGVNVRVVSLPSWEIFDRQPDDYRERVLPSSVTTRVAVEAGIKLGWEHYVGLDGAVIGMDSFGASAPSPVLYEKFGITVENVVRTARDLVSRATGK
ncbi:MAG: transketolase [Deltaproteobacteria bacterium]|nr:transketolase [Deltaproteobacteria bacterium]